MDVFVNGVHLTTHEIKPETTIGQMKILLHPHQGDSKIKLTFSDGTILDPVVFETTTYDAVNFVQYSNVFKGSRLDITKNLIWSAIITNVNGMTVDLYMKKSDAMLFLYNSYTENYDMTYEYFIGWMDENDDNIWLDDEDNTAYYLSLEEVK